MSKHIHKLKRYVYKNKEAVYFCVNNCKFKVVVGQALGKVVECWKCGNSFEMNNYSIRLDRPRCPNCVEHKNKEVVNVDIHDSIPDLRSRLSGIETTKDDLL